MRMATSSSTRRGRQSGVDLKPPQAAVVKSDGGERCGKVGTRFPQARKRMRTESGDYRRDHVRALAQRIEVDAKEVRINGVEKRTARSPGTVEGKARCTERCTGCSCARGSAA